MRGAFDLAVVGSGFAGSLLAIIARRLGRSVVLIEKGTHPRFAIGESSSPLANLLLEELSDRYGLGRVRPLAAWGTWQRTYPQIGCGLKRGFTFYGHRAGEPFARDPSRRDQLLVAASPHDEVADTHWYRADFDHFLAREAQAEGAEYLDRTALERFEPFPGGVALEGSRDGRSVALRAGLVVDASGPRGFLHRALRLPESAFRRLPATEGLYAHFENVARLEDLEAFASAGRPPYPADDAAVHHVFEDGWIWVLRFGNGVTSAGVAATPRLARELCLQEGEPAWKRLLSRFPSVEEQFAQARATLPFVHAPRIPFRAASAAGPRWILLPSAAAFVDPILSTGIPLTLRGIERLAEALEKDWGRPGFERTLADCGEKTLFEADAAALLVSALYAAFSDFELFASLSLLYFAAASYAEAARRLSRPGLAGSFLSADHPVFGPALRDCCSEVLDASARGGLAGQRQRLIESVCEAIEPLDIAGLADTSRRNWHPVEAEPLLTSAHKLRATRAEIEAMLERTGFTSKLIA
ncbi:MAG TPA: FAD-dependent oxidoreductase [Thermoanaerobaculia bacterium]|nr:FAD-dependent oxidoreductase [Thermoanaerobaculia bacterium]